ncbi:MAG: hypothetical protein U0166_03655 [Acidobacteriota bacterium]
MAIAVRGEVRVLYPVESPLSAGEDRRDASPRRADRDRHRFPRGAHRTFLSEPVRFLSIWRSARAPTTNALEEAP